MDVLAGPKNGIVLARKTVSCSLVATDPDGADRRAGLVHDADGPFGVRPETAVQVLQPLAHENHGSIAGRLRARKLGAGMVGLVRPVVEVEEAANHVLGNAVRSRIVAEHPDADLASPAAPQLPRLCSTGIPMVRLV